MKKILISLLLLVLTCVCFSTQMAGMALKFVCGLVYDCEFAYRASHWEEGRLVFSDVVLFDPSFHMHMEQASFRIDWTALPKIKGHIAIESPHLICKKEREWPTSSSSWFDVSVSMNNGKLDWGGEAFFSLDHSAHHTQMAIDWSESHALLTLKEGQWEVVLDQFRLPLLRRWISYGEVPEGLITGRFAIDRQGPVSAHLKIVDGAWHLGLGAIDKVQGSLSYNAGLGAKWELSGQGSAQGEEFPFACTGRGYFQSHWFESEISCQESLCKISGCELWKMECHNMSASAITWLQAAASLVYPETSSWQFQKGVISGKGQLSKEVWDVQFEAKDVHIKKGEYDLCFAHACGELTQDGGGMLIRDPKYEMQFSGLWDDWSAEGNWGPVQVVLRGALQGEKLPITIEKATYADLSFKGQGWINSHLDAFFAIDGEWNVLQRKIPFYCPILSKQGSEWTFDVRLARATWDFFRLSGMYNGVQILYQPHNHLFGKPLHVISQGLNLFDLSVDLDAKEMQLAQILAKEWGIDLREKMPSDPTHIQCQYRSGQLDLKATAESFSLHAAQVGSDWKLELLSDLTLTALLQPQGKIKGQGKWKEFFAADFEGKIDPSLQASFALSQVELDLSLIDPDRLEGKARGAGHFSYKGSVEADFDAEISSVKVKNIPLENEGPIHLSYTDKEGLFLRGLNLHGELDCIVDLLQYDRRSHWIFHNAQVHLPAAWLQPNLDKDLNFTANLDCLSDFSSLEGEVREGWIPYKGTYQHIENLTFSWHNGKCKAALHYLNHLLKVDLQIQDRIEGRVSIGEEGMPLTIDWEYRDQLIIHSIEGAFGGSEASFHAESPNVLVGSARLNFTELAPHLPASLAEVFEEIKMGQGYELKGRLKFENNLPSFQGILSGKSIELFGFQFRTLLAQTELSAKRVRIYDVKISDSAGVMKIDELLLEDRSPWTISIPHLTILEMRPCLLQRPNEMLGSMNPLVVRNLNITGFKGLLEDGSTYTAQGKLHFLNSYKRGETVFDWPASVLSRIVGLDLDLLIPVTGDLTFEIKEGYFNLLELTNAYSEGKRSQFFLETDPPPRMDLDGNLQIFIKMKQFVLFKITESLLISIEGVLDEPQFRLKKKRFFGLM